MSLPAVEVANKVLWVNPAFKEAPFKLEKGKQTKLGLFFTGKINPDSTDAVFQKRRNLSIMPETGFSLGPMGRSGLIGEVVFRDADGNLWRDVDVKGIGAFREEREQAYEQYSVDYLGRDSEKEKTAYGLLDYGYALHDKEDSEKFLKAGIRTHRVLAIIETEEIVDTLGINPEKRSVKEAKGSLKLIPKSMRPVIEVRAFGTKERIAYLDHEKQRERGRMAIKDARLLVAQELGKKADAFSVTEYIHWFAETLGKQVAKIRKLKLHHGYLTTHNITLDCRIVDLDSVTTAKEVIEIKKGRGHDWKIQDVYQEDFTDARDTLFSFVRMLDKLGIATYFSNSFRDSLIQKFEMAYKEELKIKV